MDKERNLVQNSPKKTILFKNLKKPINSKKNNDLKKDKKSNIRQTRPKLQFGRTTTKEYNTDNDSSDEEKKKAALEIEKLKQEIILEKYVIMVELGKGSFGQISLAYNLRDDKEVAIKKEIKKFNNHRPLTPTLKTELNVYKTLLHIGSDINNATDFITDYSGAIEIFQDEVIGVPKFYGYGEHENFYYLIIELLGPSLIELFHYCGSKKFSLPTVCMLAIQILNRIEFIHKHHYLHRDIKPENFLIGCGEKSNILYLVDFGLCKKYKDPKTHQHIQYREGRNITGTVRYVSINTHLGIEQSRRDDLESIGYVLIMFLKGSLPWQGMRVKEDKYNKIMEKKLQIPTEILCLGLPDEITHYLNYCKSLRFDDRPDYDYLKGLFIRLLNNTITSISINKDSLKFDWCFEDPKLAFDIYNTNKQKDGSGLNSRLSQDDFSDSTNRMSEGLKRGTRKGPSFNQLLLDPINENNLDKTEDIKEPTNNALHFLDSECDSKDSEDNSIETIEIKTIFKDGFTHNLSNLINEKKLAEKEDIDYFLEKLIMKSNKNFKENVCREISQDSSDLTPEMHTNLNKNLHHIMNSGYAIKIKENEKDICSENSIIPIKNEIEDTFNKTTSIEKLITSNLSNKLKEKSSNKLQKINDLISSQSINEIPFNSQNAKSNRNENSKMTNLSSLIDYSETNINNKIVRIRSMNESKEVENNSKLITNRNLNNSFQPNNSTNNTSNFLNYTSKITKLTETSNLESKDGLRYLKSNVNLSTNTNTNTNKDESHLKNFKLEFNMLSNSMQTKESKLSMISENESSIPLKFSKDQIIKISKEPMNQNYIIVSNLGTGSIGTVKKVRHKKLNEDRAMKIIEKKKNVKGEIEILKKISHPNIISIYEIYEDSRNYYIITEFLEGGELFEMIATQVNFSEVEAANIMKQLLSSLVYLHNKNIVHRDLKPENILLVKKKDSNFEIKLIDFSTAKIFEKNQKLSKFVGTSYYVAPEVLEESYDEKCDVWSCGVILYILLCGYPPFNGSSNHEIYNAIKKNNPSFPPEEWKDISKEAIDLIKQMLNKETQKRFSAFKCLNHKWFKILDNQKDKNQIETNKLMSINVIRKMSDFVKQNKFKKAILQFISTQFNLKEEEEQLRNVFAQFDPLGKGIISKVDFKASLVNLFGENEAERLTESIFRDIDLDGSGEISYDEFITSIIDARKVLTNAQLEIAFKMIDKDNSGSITVQEICNVFGGNIITWKDIIDEVDLNGDGEIDFEEFKLMMCGLDKNKLI